MKKILVIMAAGMGSRYGGLKQIDPVGPDGEIIIDYSIYDAWKAGFQKVIFIIRRENLEVFQEVIGNKVAKVMEVAYVFQDLDKLPEGFAVPQGRVKPWGTAHAVLCCEGQLDGPFAVINADDFYGRDAFMKLSVWMDGLQQRKSEYAMAGYVLKNTLTENGYVSRGVCQVAGGFLQSVTERTKIMRVDGRVCYQEQEAWHPLEEDAVVSMNCWAFTPDFAAKTGARFSAFLKANQEHLQKAEFFLPSVVCEMIEEGSVRVRVLETDEKWMGVTYQEDKEPVRSALREKINQGLYPCPLWPK